MALLSPELLLQKQAIVDCGRYLGRKNSTSMHGDSFDTVLYCIVHSCCCCNCLLIERLHAMRATLTTLRIHDVSVQPAVFAQSLSEGRVARLQALVIMWRITECRAVTTWGQNRLWSIGQSVSMGRQRIRRLTSSHTERELIPTSPSYRSLPRVTTTAAKS